MCVSVLWHTCAHALVRTRTHYALSVRCLNRLGPEKLLVKKERISSSSSARSGDEEILREKFISILPASLPDRGVDST